MKKSLTEIIAEAPSFRELLMSLSAAPEGVENTLSKQEGIIIKDLLALIAYKISGLGAVNIRLQYIKDEPRCLTLEISSKPEGRAKK